MNEKPEKKKRKGGSGTPASRGGPAAATGGDAPVKAEGGEERIAKRLARAGVASRRDAEAMILAGRVSLNGKVLSSPAINVGPQDRIEVDGAPLPTIERTRLFLFHKPSGVVTTNRDPEGRRTVFDILPEALPRVITVGRLDLNTEGLLLLTNDGGLARVLELPSTGWLRRYRVRVHGKVELEALEKLKEGIAVDGVFYGAIEATLDRVQGTNAWLTLGLREGKNREVRNVLRALNLDVTRLIRISYGPFQLGDLAEGTVQEIRGRTLRDQLGERLIGEAGADFDAPVVKPLAREKERAEPAEGAREGRERTAQGETRSRRDAGDDARRERPARPDRPGRQERRDSALDRLDTRPARDRKADDKRPARKDDKRPEKRPEKRAYEVPSRRTANVWMAPGARPVGARKKAEREAEDRGEGPGQRTRRPSAPRDGKPAARGDRPFGKSAAPRRDRRDEGDGTAAPRGRARPEGRPGEKKFGRPRGDAPVGGPRSRPRPAGSPSRSDAGDGSKPSRSAPRDGGRPPRSGTGPRKGPPRGRRKDPPKGRG